MTESNLFRTTLVTLASTLALPLIVGLSGLGAPQNTSTNDLVKRYVGATNQTDQTKTNDAQNDKAKDQPTDQAKQDEAKPTDTTDNDQPVKNTAGQPGAAKQAGTYTVKEGDTYGCIAEKYYGSYDQWARVYGENAGWPGFNEYDLAVGATLKMPAVSANEVLPQTSLCR